jgi:hypothetical protein
MLDAVLGLSMTPTSVGLVLVEGHDADGATMDGNAFDVRQSAIETSEQATAAVLRTEALAATRGLRLHSIGVTWSEDADAEASALMRSLSESGFDNVIAIRLPEATEALARGMAAVLGYATTAVCVIEPDAVIALVVNTSDGAVQTAFNHAIDSDESLISWLSTVFTKADWQPEALVVVGSAGGSSRTRCRCPSSHRRRLSWRSPAAQHWRRRRPSNYRWKTSTAGSISAPARAVPPGGTTAPRSARRRGLGSAPSPCWWPAC